MGKTFRQDGHQVRALSGRLDRDPPGRLWSRRRVGLGQDHAARLLLGLTAPDEGSVAELDGAPYDPRSHGRSGDDVRALQIIFQDPDSAR